MKYGCSPTKAENIDNFDLLDVLTVNLGKA